MEHTTHAGLWANRTNRIDNDSGWGLYNPTNEKQAWNELMGEIELQKAPYELTRDDLVGKEFSTLCNAELFYNLYSKAMGYSIRKSHKRKTPDGEVKGRTWLCWKEGKRDQKFLNLRDRKKEAKYLTREDCHVRFRVNKSRKTNKWIVKEFVTKHSHELAIAQHTQFMRSSRQISDGALHTAKSLKSAGVRTCHIMGYMATQVGGFDNMRFVMKDLYNKLGSNEDFVVDDLDAAKAIGYLEHKAELDKGFYGRYSVDEERRLQHLFWADSSCRSDYKIFGHALSFDTTYRSNKYGKPLLVFVGINHHFKTTIFALVLLDNETHEAYKWALSTFIDCMDGVHPRTVITDGDLAMKSAINEIMPKTVHRLCTLHLQQNAISNIKLPTFQRAFSRLMLRHYTEPEFDSAWSMMVKDFGLENNAWITSMYEKRHSWADTFLRGNFFAGMKTTQRSEGMHAYLKSKIKSTTKLTPFVKMMEVALAWLRQKEAHDDYISCHTKPVTNITNMTEIEDFFSKVYSRDMYFRVRDEMKREGQYLVSQVEETNEFMTLGLTKYGTKRVVRQVVVEKLSMCFVCNCYGFPTNGIPCRHIFATMKAMHLTKVPETLLCKRWMKNAKQFSMGNDVTATLGAWERPLVDNDARFGHLVSKFSELAYLAAKSEKLFKVATSECQRLTIMLVGLAAETNSDNEGTERVENPKNVNNPAYANTKGSGGGGRFGGRAKKKCSSCQQMGHNKKTCKFKQVPSLGDDDDVVSKSLRHAKIGKEREDLSSDNNRVDVGPQSKEDANETYETVDLSRPDGFFDEQFKDSFTATMDIEGTCWWGKPYGE